MEITKENVLKAIEVFKKMDSGNRSFTEGILQRGSRIISKDINFYLCLLKLSTRISDVAKYRMSAELVEIVTGKLTLIGLTGQIYVNGKQRQFCF